MEEIVKLEGMYKKMEVDNFGRRAEDMFEGNMIEFVESEKEIMNSK